MHLPKEFWEIYESKLKSLNLYEEACAGSKDSKIHGGQTPADTNKHFTHRFPNSALRVQVAITDPQEILQSIPDQIRATFANGHVKVLDLACGTGAGSISLLISLHVLRQARIVPTLPLNIAILGADYSAHALQIFSDLIVDLADVLATSGINVSLHTLGWDASEIPQTDDLCTYWFKDKSDGEERFVLISNISGSKESGFKEIFEKSIDHVAARISNCTSTLLWVEPDGPGAIHFLKKIYQDLISKWSWFAKRHVEISLSTSFQWHHKFLGKNLRGGVSLAQYKRASNDQN